MSITQCQQETTYTFNGRFTQQKKKSVNFKIQSQESLTQSKSSTRQKKIQKAPCLPVNFFHSPGQYSKMIIKCTPPATDSFVDRKMGIIRNLEFINQPLFEKEKQKKYLRLAEYSQKVKLKNTSKQDNKSSNTPCTCCCCDNYCRQCAKTSLCDISRKQSQIKKEDFLIDIEAVKRGEKPKPIFFNKEKKIKSVPEEISHPHFCCQGKQKSSLRIDQLINNTLIKQIEIKREQEIQKLSKKEQQHIRDYFNQRVRELNRPQSAFKKQEAKVLQLSKKQIRQNYWRSVKDLVAFQLRKQKIEPSVMKSQKGERVMSPKRELRLTMQEMHSLRIIHGREAMRQQRLSKKKQKNLEKMKAKKLLALAAKQADIIKKEKKKKFKPSQSMIQHAFKMAE